MPGQTCRARTCWRGGMAVENAPCREGPPFASRFWFATRNEEKVALAWADKPAPLLGIQVDVRTVEFAQYRVRSTPSNFDVILWRWMFTLSPARAEPLLGKRFRDRIKGSRNYAHQDPSSADRAGGRCRTRDRTDRRVPARFDRVVRAPLFVPGLTTWTKDVLACGETCAFVDVDPSTARPRELWMSSRSANGRTGQVP